MDDYRDFWTVQRLVYRGTWRAARLLVRAGQYRAAHSSLQRERANASRGVLGPGDGPTPPGYDLLDYRGLAPTRHLRLVDRGLPVGEVIDVHAGLAGKAALPLSLMLRHACVIGPSGAGKTRSIVAPWIVALLSAGVSVVTIDVKGDLLKEITDHAAATGRGPLGATGRVWDYSSARSHRWNFFREVTSERSIEAVVVSLLGRQKEDDPQPYFYQRDYRWLKGLLMLTLESRGPTAEARHVLDLVSDQKLLRQLVPLSQAGVDVRDLANLDPSDYSRDVSGLLNVLSVFRQPNIVRSVSTSDFTLPEVMIKPTLLIAVARLSDGRLGEQMSSLLVSQFTMALLERFGSTVPRPVVLMLDEAARLRQRINLEETLSVARGAGVGVCMAGQDVAQFGNQEQQSALFANCHTFISMYGVSPSTADYLSKRLGNRLREDLSVTTNGKRGLFEPPSTARQMSSAPVLGPREIMFPPYGNHSAVVHCPSVSPGPFLVDLEQP